MQADPSLSCFVCGGVPPTNRRKAVFSKDWDYDDPGSLVGKFYLLGMTLERIPASMNGLART